jgi:hypothetical protein
VKELDPEISSVREAVIIVWNNPDDLFLIELLEELPVSPRGVLELDRTYLTVEPLEI